MFVLLRDYLRRRKTKPGSFSFHAFLREQGPTTGEKDLDTISGPVLYKTPCARERNMRKTF
jgi:hypothetical protein